MELLILETEEPGDLPFYADMVAKTYPQVIVHVASSEAEALKKSSRIEVIAAKAHSVSASLVAACPQLRWIQALTTGTDHLATLDLPENCIVTSARGIHGPQMAELAFLYMLALSRDLPRMYRNQLNAKWERWPQRLLIDKTAVIVGVGAIGEDIALRCKAFGMRVVGVSSHRAEAPGFDLVEPRDNLEAAAREADFLIVLVPYGPQTHELIDQRILAAMRPQSVLINIARGKVVDERALADALEKGQIRGAGLDVFQTEPLPAASPLWRSDRTIVTPRIGGMSDSYARQASVVLLENLAHYLAGQPQAVRNRIVFDHSGDTS